MIYVELVYRGDDTVAEVREYLKRNIDHIKAAIGQTIGIGNEPILIAPNCIGRGDLKASANLPPLLIKINEGRGLKSAIYAGQICDRIISFSGEKPNFEFVVWRSAANDYCRRF